MILPERRSISWLSHCKIIESSERDSAHDFLRVAYLNAARSKDPSTTNGAVLVSSKTSKTINSWNCFPRGVNESAIRWEKPLKYEFIEHAERNAIFEAARQGVSTAGACLYCTWYACVDCARSIIQAGIGEVVGHASMFEGTPDRWRDSISKAFEMFAESGVKCYAYDGRIFESDCPELRFNGEVWRP